VTGNNENERDVEEIDAEVEAVFKQVQKEYALALPEKMAALNQAIHAAESQPHSDDLLVYALSETHRLKGTLGSYGFPELAELVASVEKLLRQSADKSGTKASPAFWKQIDGEIQSLLLQADQTAINLSRLADSS